MTTWTERSDPASTEFLEGPVKFKKMSDNFYYGGGGFTGGLVPKKLANNFYELAGESYPGSYFAGKRSDNFIGVRSR
jgi:hypothetical protein